MVARKPMAPAARSQGSTFILEAPGASSSYGPLGKNAARAGLSTGRRVGGLLVAVVTWREMPGLVGVLVGASISAAVASIVALEARRVQIAASTWARRLEVHQEAFSLWHRCWSVVHVQDQGKKDETLKKAEDWWFENCLYLSEGTRTSFKRMIKSVHMHSDIVEMGRGQLKEEGWAQQVYENWDLIATTGQRIIEASGSHICDDVIKRLGPGDPYGGVAG
jgi:hypothetical protein